MPCMFEMTEEEKSVIISFMTRIILTLTFFIISTLPAKADYFLWEDPKSGLTMTFPDTWKRQSSRDGTGEVLRIVAPSNGDDPVCTVNVKDDKRYTIFPADYGDAVQRTAVSIPFWKRYMDNYDDYTIDRVFDGGGLGRWRASYAFASYGRRAGTAYQQRRGLMFASLYYDKLFIVECSSLNHAYENWGPNFRSVIKSIDFKKMYHEHMTGEYANFLRDADLNFWAQTGPEGTVAY